jgi:DNA-binding MarR family transcriptional regulator
LSEQALEAWKLFVLGHSALVGALNADLVSGHGLTINDYEVLLRLAQAPDRRMRRVDLAQSVLLTASGITRLLDGLEREGYVERAQCDTDRRVAYAVLTDAGGQKLREAAGTHLRGIQERFAERYSEQEIETLCDLLGRIGTDDDTACEP